MAPASKGALLNIHYYYYYYYPFISQSLELLSSGVVESQFNLYSGLLYFFHHSKANSDTFESLRVG